MVNKLFTKYRPGIGARKLVQEDVVKNEEKAMSGNGQAILV
jgi:hypothetical protein